MILRAGCQPRAHRLPALLGSFLRWQYDHPNLPPTMRELGLPVGEQAGKLLDDIASDGLAVRVGDYYQARSYVLRRDAVLSVTTAERYIPRETWPRADAVRRVRLYAGAIHFEMD